MDNLKRLREQVNDAREKMENIVANKGNNGFSDEQREEFNNAKETFDRVSEELAIEESMENVRKDRALRNNNDGSNKEYKPFRMIDALAYAANPNNVSDDVRNFYAELDKEAKRKASNEGVSLEGGNGIVLPTNALNNNFRNDVTVETEGDDIVFDENGGFINALQERLVLTQLGADFMDGLVGDVRFPKESNTLSGNWEGEVSASDEQTPTYGNVKMTPNRYSFYVDVSNQALRQTSPSIEARVQRQIMDGVQRGIESAAISGSAGPNGLLDVATLISGSTGNGSGSLAYGDVVDLETQVGSANALRGSLGYLGSAKVRGVAKQTKKDSGSGLFVWDGNEVNGYTAAASNLSPDGASYSPFFFGNFEDMMIGMWGGMEIITDPYTQATNGLTRYHINVYTDVAFAHDESFAYYLVANS